MSRAVGRSGRDGCGARAGASLSRADSRCALGFAITATSANLSGSAGGDVGRATIAAALADRLDAVIDGGAHRVARHRRSCELTHDGPRLLRAGAIAWERVLKFARVTRHAASRSTSTDSHERAALVGLISGASRRFDPEHSLDELAGLASAAGADVVLRVMQERAKPDPATFLGSGKLEALAASCDEVRADVVIFDNELSPAQLRNIEEALDRKVLDRTQLILDIFARRARTREGKLQVELAQLQVPDAAARRLERRACRGSAAASAPAAPAKRNSKPTGGASATASA